MSDSECACIYPHASAHDCALETIEAKEGYILDDCLLVEFEEENAHAQCECWCHKDDWELDNEE